MFKSYPIRYPLYLTDMKLEGSGNVMSLKFNILLVVNLVVVVQFIQLLGNNCKKYH